MNHAAKTLGAPMTSFLQRTPDPLVYDIRHFSPDGNENHICGHATLAAAEHLACLHPVLRQNMDVTFRLNPKYAINTDNAFRATINGDDITLVMPAITELQRMDDPSFYTQLADSLNVAEEDIVKPCYYAPRIINYVVELKDQGLLLAVNPDFKKLKAFAAGQFPHEGIMLTTPAQMPGFDLLTRVFLPIIGVDEDVACGSSNCSIIPYWTMFRSSAFPPGKQDFTALFPYPPRMHENFVGGVQNLHMDLVKKEIRLTGQAEWQKTHSLDLAPKRSSLGKAPPPPSPP